MTRPAPLNSALKDLDRLLSILHNVTLSEVERKIKAKRDGDRRFSDGLRGSKEIYEKTVEDQRRQLEELEDRLKLHATITTGTRKRFLTGAPADIIGALDPRTRQQLDVSWDPPLTRMGFDLSLQDNGEVVFRISADDHDWLRGAYDMVTRELRHQVPPDAWLRASWVGIVGPVVAALGAPIIASNWIDSQNVLNWIAILAAVVVIFGGVWIIVRMRTFELVQPGKRSRAARSFAAIAYFGAIVLGTILSLIFGS